MITKEEMVKFNEYMQKHQNVIQQMNYRSVAIAAEYSTKKDEISPEVAEMLVLDSIISVVFHEFNGKKMPTDAVMSVSGVMEMFCEKYESLKNKIESLKEKPEYSEDDFLKPYYVLANQSLKYFSVLCAEDLL